MRQMLIAVLFFSASLSAQLNWVTNPANGHRYALTATMSWNRAEALAVANGGHLATIRSQAEQDWIVNTFWNTVQDDIWIGINDAATEGTYVWASGAPVTYTNWCNGQPNNPTSCHDYGHLWIAATACHKSWVLDCDTWPEVGLIEVIPQATYTTYRQSCASSVGTPQLTNLTLPRLGMSLRLQVDNLVPNSLLNFLIIGFNDQVWQAVQLPFDLAVIGAPGCAMNIDPVEFRTSLSNASGIALPVIQIPNNTALVTLTFYNQFLSLDAPPGRALRLTTTNAGKGVIGF